MTYTYLVNEIHQCLQGEGPNIGTPSILVRFQICNLRCTWCDTPYTHTYKSDSFKRYTAKELVTEIIKLNHQNIILTGGEPTLHNILPLVKFLKEISSEYHFEVETNGTQIPHLKYKDFSESDYSLIQWNVSPKFENAGEKIVPESLKHWSTLANKNFPVLFKFVIRQKHQETDLHHTLKIINEFSIPKKCIFLMAEGFLQKSQISNKWLHDICLEHGFHLTPRLHILIFGPKRGV